jgi:basic membrane protein A and related proteins
LTNFTFYWLLINKQEVYNLQEFSIGVLEMQFIRMFVLLILSGACLLTSVCSCTASPSPLTTEAPRQSSEAIALVIDTKDLANDDFNKICIEGAEKAKKEFGITYEYGIANNFDEYYQAQIRFSESKKYGLIIGVGGTQAEALARCATEYPNQKFALLDAVVSKPNVVSIEFRDEQSSFLVGALAAMVSQKSKLGFIGGMDIPAIQRFLAGYYAGAKFINQNIAGGVSYVGSFSDQDRAGNLAMVQIAGGADIIFCAAGASTLGVIEISKTKNFSVICPDTDQRYRAPGNILICTLKRVDVAVYDVIKSIVYSNFKSGALSYGLKENGVGTSIDNALPVVTTQMKSKIQEIQKKIISGEIKVPQK